MRSIICLSVVGVVLLLQTVAAQQRILEKERALERLAVEAEALWADRCSFTGQCARRERPCTVPACGDHFNESAGFRCTSAYGVDERLCGIDCPGMVRSQTHSVVRMPHGADFADGDLQAFVCNSDRLTPAMRREHANGTGPLKSWTYISDLRGAVRVFPGAPQAREQFNCDTYDARTRPWYFTAISGPKEVIFLVDVSEWTARYRGVSNEEDLKIVIIHQMVDTILSTLTPADFFTIILFGEGLTPRNQVMVGGEFTLHRATRENIWYYAQKQRDHHFFEYDNEDDRDQDPADDPFIASAFEWAFSIFLNGDPTGCKYRQIIAITPAHLEDADNVVHTIIERDQNLLQQRDGHKAHIFTFSIGDDRGNDFLLQNVACNNQGVWTRVSSRAFLAERFREYFMFTSATVVANTTRWSVPYLDSFGLGLIVTATRPLYDRSTATPRLIGVIATDVTMADLRDAGVEDDTLLNNLIQQSAQCPKNLLVGADSTAADNFRASCHLQQLRETTLAGRCSIVTANTPSQAQCEGVENFYSTSCPAVGNLNDQLCENINSLTRVGDIINNTAVASCCGSNECRTFVLGGAAGNSIMFAVIAVIAVALATSM